MIEPCGCYRDAYETFIPCVYHWAQRTADELRLLAMGNAIIQAVPYTKPPTTKED